MADLYKRCYICPVSNPPGLREQLPSLWRPLHAVLGQLDRGIEDAYAELGIQGVRPRFSMALMFLDLAGPMTIRRLADECGVTHSAMSQSVTQMRAGGLVETAPGADARARMVSLTPLGRRTVPVLRAEWAATEAALEELEAELPYRPSQVARDLAQAVARRPFAERLLAHLDRDALDLA
jgi:DNA-binding MarR family transcriptional regulator